jgi:hypothetical protein
MNRRSIFGLSAITLLGLALLPRTFAARIIEGTNYRNVGLRLLDSQAARR